MSQPDGYVFKIPGKIMLCAEFQSPFGLELLLKQDCYLRGLFETTRLIIMLESLMTTKESSLTSFARRIPWSRA